jgi:hypothetical protein
MRSGILVFALRVSTALRLTVFLTESGSAFFVVGRVRLLSFVIIVRHRSSAPFLDFWPPKVRRFNFNRLNRMYSYDKLQSGDDLTVRRGETILIGALDDGELPSAIFSGLPNLQLL